MKTTCHIVLILLLLGGCKSETAEDVDFQAKECKKQPPFIRNAGFNPSRSAFSTSDKKKMGLLLMEINNPRDTNGIRYYQHPSWKTGGWLAPIQLDDKGNLFTAPAPFVNVLNNPGNKQNIIYKVDGVSGVMEKFSELPQTEKPNLDNPYGILSMTFMCETGRIFASSVAGSSRYKEAGGIYSVDAVSGAVKDRLTGYDAFGLGISYMEGKRKLYFGRARTSEIYSVGLTAKGNFAGKPELCLSIGGLGPRGDDKAKKISFNAKGDMKVEGYEFNFNLIAPTEKQSTYYYFRYNANGEKWQQTGGNW